jgi:acetylornithine deacetylase
MRSKPMTEGQPHTSEEMLARLVGFDTTSRLSNLKLIDFVTAYLAAHGIASTRIHNEDKTKANLFATIGPGGAGGVVLSGHTDVVPVDDQDWSSDPFGLSERGGRLYGRGSSDMKGFLACVLALVPEMMAAGLKQPIHLAFSYDEEVGCIGVGSMIAHVVAQGIRPTLCIVGEPTSMRVINAHKSINSFRTKITGHETHSSRTEEGVSAIFVAADLLAFLEGLAEEMKRRGDPSGRFDPPYTSLSVGTIEGGTAVNIVPRHCTFAWEYRALPSQESEEIVRRFHEHCASDIVPALKHRAPGAGVETTARSSAPGLLMPPGSPEETLVLGLAERNSAEAVSYATEAGLFQQAEIPTFVCGPGDIAQAHKPDEFIEVSQLRACEAFLRRLIRHIS